MSAHKGINYSKKIDLITEEIFKEMEELYKIGMHDRHIYDYFCIPSRTFQWWKMRGRQVEKLLEDGKKGEYEDSEGNKVTELIKLTEEDFTPEERKYLRLLRISKKGRAQLIKRNLEAIKDAASGGTWQAAAWKLERTDHKAFGKKETVKHTGKIKIDEAKKKKLDKIFGEKE